MLAFGTKIGPYEILAPIGAGGMGEVYRARDTRLGRDVAIKVLPASFASDPERLRRFEQEARATGMLNHPNILAVYDVGTHQGSPYLVTELLEGQTLREELPTPRRKALDYARQIAARLAAAHAKGVTHRDLKPDNLRADGRIAITVVRKDSWWDEPAILDPKTGQVEKLTVPYSGDAFSVGWTPDGAMVSAALPMHGSLWRFRSDVSKK